MDKPLEVTIQPIDSSLPDESSTTTQSSKMDSPRTPHHHRHYSAPSFSSRLTGSTSPTPPIAPAGRYKSPPVCRVPALRKMNMSAETLSQWCFEPKDLLQGSEDKLLHEEALKVARGGYGVTQIKERLVDKVGATLDQEEKISSNEWAHFKRAILQRTESRNGRDHQRFASDPLTGQMFRLTTGSVPILNDGRILLISSSRKEEWILPKGGWESDETLEVSALRETYEEGGILGTLGPKLTEIEYETRKAKKRRLELESLKKKFEVGSGTVSGLPPATTINETISYSSAVSVHSTSSSVCHSEDDLMQGSGHSRDQQSVNLSNETSKLNSAASEKDCLIVPATIKHETKNTVSEKTDTDAASLDSVNSYTSDASSSCGYVRMLMFPLYVLEVREHWPESGRARKAVDIDTAIEMMKPRPEFHQVLLEVKEKGYHLKPHGRIQASVDVSMDRI
eukprot:CAMPEP_0176490500 /NCGR_PEP_ID=MMETSP0200_2-20121128/7905_1 /TAXON_ID=947934 /ORGANISM="Chaetoceros sp., Strain GSL56" /LENGTH=451 /DNA_ID=CAMNT_0017887813 /DNA_START=638 /DNA_END=1993 /DNA_ORIENTATION=-